MQKLWNSVKSGSGISLQLWKTWIVMWMSIGLWKVLERIYKF
jgi:hypothetical protein